MRVVDPLDVAGLDPASSRRLTESRLILNEIDSPERPDAAVSSDSAPAGEKPAPIPNLPPFYIRPWALDPVRHATAGIKLQTDFAFAGSTNAIAVTIGEFASAQAHYPIVFTGPANPMSLAVMGVVSDRNLFVRADGSWRPRCYIPGYVRRYPFVFDRIPSADQYLLCIDEGADLFMAAGGEPLFMNGKPSPLTERALQFCSAFQNQAEETERFAKALWDQDLLIENHAEITLRNGEKRSLTGFHVVDEARFNALPDATVLEWRRRGWLALIYAHLMSTQQWAILVEIASDEATHAGI